MTLLKTGRLHPGFLVRSRYMPPLWLEYWYFLQVFYSIMGPALGIAVGGLGAVMLIGLAAVCVLRMGARTLIVLQNGMLWLACAVAFVLVQVFVFRESIIGGNNREFINWATALVVVQLLALRRGFIHRFAVAATLIG